MNNHGQNPASWAHYWARCSAWRSVSDVYGRGLLGTAGIVASLPNPETTL